MPFNRRDDSAKIGRIRVRDGKTKSANLLEYFVLLAKVLVTFANSDTSLESQLLSNRDSKRRTII